MSCSIGTELMYGEKTEKRQCPYIAPLHHRIRQTALAISQTIYIFKKIIEKKETSATIIYSHEKYTAGKEELITKSMIKTAIF